MTANTVPAEVSVVDADNNAMTLATIAASSAELPLHVQGVRIEDGKLVLKLRHHDTDESPEAKVIRAAVQSGLILEWAEIKRYDDDAAWLHLRRLDTDGMPMRCYPRDIRKAMSRAGKIGALTASELTQVEVGDVRAATADALIQIAVVGRVLYIDEPITGKR